MYLESARLQEFGLEAHWSNPNSYLAEGSYITIANICLWLNRMLKTACTYSIQLEAIIHNVTVVDSNHQLDIKLPPTAT
jgi:hypothetical protein